MIKNIVIFNLEVVENNPEVWAGQVLVSASNESGGEYPGLSPFIIAKHFVHYPRKFSP